MSAAGLIINERSNRVRSILDDLLYVARQFPSLQATVLNGIDGLDRTLADLNRAHADTVIVAGGDGTIQAALTDSINMHRFDHVPGYVAVPCGMTNVIAADCGLHGSPVESLDRFLWRRSRGEVKRVKRALMGVKIGAHAPVYGFFLGAGAFYDAVKFSRGEVQAKGAKRSLALGVSIGGAILNAAFGEKRTEAPLTASIACDEAPFAGEQPLTLAMMTTLKSLMLGVYPFWGKGEGDLAVTTIGFPARNMLGAATYALRGREARWFRDAGYHSWRTRALEADFAGRIVFDGELLDVGKGDLMMVETSHDADFLV